jgi:hypothetical protein
MERHHPLGRDNPMVAEIAVAIPGNWHRALEKRHRCRPEILKRPGENPLHQIAAAVARLSDVAHVIADFATHQGWPEWVAELAEIFGDTADRAADWLLILAGKLDEWYGPDWVSDMPKWRPR